METVMVAVITMMDTTTICQTTNKTLILKGHKTARATTIRKVEVMPMAITRETMARQLQQPLQLCHRLLEFEDQFRNWTQNQAQPLRA